MPDEWDDPTDPETGAEEPEEVEIDEATQALIDAKAQEQVNAFKSTYGRRFNRTIEALKARGETVDEDGNPAVADPARFGEYAQRFTAPAAKPAAAAEETAEDDDPPDATYDPKGYRAWLDRQIDKAADRKLAPLQAQLQQANDLAARPILSGLAEAARGALEKRGLGQYADHPQFAQMVTNAVKQGFPREQWDDPRAIAVAAMSVVPFLEDDELPHDVGTRTVRQPAPRDTPGSLITQAARAGIQQTAASRGQSAGDQYSGEEVELAKLAGEMWGEAMTPAEWRALGQDAGDDGDGRNYRKARAAQQRRGGK